MNVLHHSDNPIAARAAKCERCGKTYVPHTSAWDLCLECLELVIAEMPTEELQDVPGAVLALVGLKEEYFRE